MPTSEPCDFWQIRQRVFGAIYRTPEIHVHQSVQDTQIDIVEYGAHRYSRIANKHVDSAERLDAAIYQPFAILRFGYVGRTAHRFAAVGTYLRHQIVQFLFAARAQHEFRAHSGIDLRHSLAYARRCAGDDNRFTFQYVFHKYVFR